MGAMTASLSAVETALIAAGCATVIKEYSGSTPPTAQHAILSVEASSLDREDVDNFGGNLTVTADWYYPGAKADGQTEYLAAMDAFDAVVVAMTSSLDRTCMSVDPSEGFEKLEESADLAHWYNGTVRVTFMRKEPATV